MKVCGFTIIRNAVKLDYPIVEAISSILPVCDEVIVAMGKSDDQTRDLITSIATNKIRILDTVWDDSLREGGKTLAVETDKAFQAIPSDADWCFYIQADEVLPEKYHATVLDAMRKHLHDTRIDGLLFNYLHFYGSYDYIGSSWSWYRREIRIIRNNKSFFSYKDAQGFRKKPNEKLLVKHIDAYIYHYGWVRNPRAMKHKQIEFGKLYNTDEWLEAHVEKADEFDYGQIDSLEKFEGVHPRVMEDRIKRLNWKFDHDLSKNRLSLRERLKRFLSMLVGRRVGEYKNYKLI